MAKVTLNFQEIKKQVQRISRRLSSEIIRNRGYLDMKKRQPFRTAAIIRISVEIATLIHNLLLFLPDRQQILSFSYHPAGLLASPVHILRSSEYYDPSVFPNGS